MELISGFFFVVIIGIISYVFSKKEVKIKENNEISEVNHKELERRKRMKKNKKKGLAKALGEFSRVIQQLKLKFFGSDIGFK